MASGNVLTCLLSAFESKFKDRHDLRPAYTDITHSGASSESEYYSASENEPDRETDSENSVDDDSNSKNKSCGVRSCSCSSRISDSEDDDSYDRRRCRRSNKNTSGGHHKGLSKKQKRRRRERMREFGDFDVPFKESDDLEDQPEPADLVVHRSVPSLLDLCMRRTWIADRNNDRRLPSAPQIVKQNAFAWKNECKKVSRHLASLLKLLHLVEKNGFPYMHVNGKALFSRVARNVWSCGIDLFKFAHDPLEYTGHRASSWLSYTYFNNTEWENSVYVYELWKWKPTVGVISVVASVLDLMLPQSTSIQETYNKVDKGDITTRLKLIEKSLRHRYPEVMKNVYRHAVPYTLWARGNFELAAEWFKDLARKAEDVLERAMFLSEAARMYSFVGNTELARHFHKKATEAAGERPSGGPQHHGEITAQGLILAADVYDQGPMTKEKSVSASMSWRTALACGTTCPQSGCLRAIDSFFCFHSGKGEDHVTRLKEGLTLIQSVQSRYPVDYAMAVVKAWLGVPNKRKPRMLSCGMEVPPLEILLKSGTPPPLDVIWRTQLGPMRIVTNQLSFEGDFQSATNLNLHLTADGFLSCDLQMALPPIRALNLDPYTGFHVFGPSSSIPKTWHSINPSKLETVRYTSNGEFVTPTVVELYHDDKETKVEFLSKCSCLAYQGEPPSLTEMFLEWTNGKGEKARLNVLSWLRKAYRDYVRANIDNEALKCCPTTNKDHLLAAIDFCYFRSLSMSWQTLQLVCSQLPKILKKEVSTKKKTDKKERRKAQRRLTKMKKRMKDDLSKDTCHETFSADMVDYVSYGETLVLVLSINAWENTFVKFGINCSSKSDFLNPCIEVFPAAEDLHALTRSYREHRIPHGDVIWMECCSDDRKNRIVHVCGEGGTGIEDIPIGPMDGSDEFTTPVVHGRKLFGSSGNRVLCNGLTVEDPIQGPDLKSTVLKLLVLPSHILVITEDGLHLMDPESLDLVPIAVKTRSPSLSLSEDCRTIEARNLSRVEIISEKKVTDTDGRTSYETAVAADTHLILFRGGSEIYVDLCLEVSGYPRDFCSINKTVGFLVSVTLQNLEEENYRENLFHYNYSGQIVGMLPFLGPGPRNMFPAFLAGNDKAASRDNVSKKPGWYVFLRDGHEGIMGIKLRYSKGN